MAPGFDEFSAELDQRGHPMVGLPPAPACRLMIHAETGAITIHSSAEGGCGVYLPEGYFHLRPAKNRAPCRFTCLPVAAPQPQQRKLWEACPRKPAVAVVPMRSLSPRELAQNAALPGSTQNDASRDFDELLFAGVAEADVRRFVRRARIGIGSCVSAVSYGRCVGAT